MSKLTGEMSTPLPKINKVHQISLKKLKAVKTKEDILKFNEDTYQLNHKLSVFDPCKRVSLPKLNFTGSQISNQEAMNMSHLSARSDQLKSIIHQRNSSKKIGSKTSRMSHSSFCKLQIPDFSKKLKKVENFGNIKSIDPLLNRSFQALTYIQMM